MQGGVWQVSFNLLNANRGKLTPNFIESMQGLLRSRNPINGERALKTIVKKLNLTCRWVKVENVWLVEVKPTENK
jgi:hypothetical protein